MSGEGWFAAVAGVVIAAVAALLIFGAVAAYREHHRCTDNGGTWVSVNCRLVEDQICTTTTDYGNGMVITSCMPTTSTRCDTVCRGARPEAGGAR